MTGGLDDYSRALDRAAGHARAWLGSLDDRRVPPEADADAVAARVGGALPHAGLPPEDVVDLLVAGAEPGLMAMPSGRFFGFVIGGTLPAALAADWLVSAWDQNAAPALRDARDRGRSRRWPAAWLLDLLGLPAGADVGFVTGATMANFTCLAAGRDRGAATGPAGTSPSTG